MLYSSGTTGRPKGIVRKLSPRPVDQFDPLTGWLQESFGLTEATVYLSPAPLAHPAPLGFSRAVQGVGATVLVMEPFEPSEFLRLLPRYGVTMTQMVPSMFARLLKLPDAERAAADTSSLRAANWRVE